MCTTRPDLFPSDINSNWDYPSKISNAIFEFSNINGVDNLVLFEQQIVKLGCKFLEIRIYNALCNSDLKRILYFVVKSGLVSVDIFLKYSDSIDFDLLKREWESCGKIGNIVLHSAIHEAIIFESPSGRVYTTKERVSSDNHCGVISKDLFSINIQTINESKNFNSCLNRKISIDQYGSIKNCPSMKVSYGNICDVEISDVIRNNDFKEYWDVTKDHISVCKDCEFRYVCTDCRAFTEDPDDIYSKPLKCGYNPYTGEWSEWSKNPLKQKAIKHYGFNPKDNMP